MATRVCVLDGGGPKDSENTLNSFLTKRDEDGFWQIGTDMGGEMVARAVLQRWLLKCRKDGLDTTRAVFLLSIIFPLYPLDKPNVLL